MIKIFADFNNADAYGRIRLNAKGTLEDIMNVNLLLHDEVKVILDDSDGLRTVGCIEFSDEEKIWVAKINWDAIEEYFE